MSTPEPKKTKRRKKDNFPPLGKDKIVLHLKLKTLNYSKVVHGGQSLQHLSILFFVFCILPYSAIFYLPISVLSLLHNNTEGGTGRLSGTRCVVVLSYRYPRKEKKLKELTLLSPHSRPSPYSAPHDYTYRLTL